MADVEVHIDFAAGLRRVGTLHRQARRGGEAVVFEYHPDWLAEAARFSLKPALTLGQGAFAPAAVRPRILTTNIDLDEGTCDLDLVESVAELFGLGAKSARQIIAEVGRATTAWRETAATVGARPAETGVARGNFAGRVSRRPSAMDDIGRWRDQDSQITLDVIDFRER